MNTQRVIALLGRKDEPTDAVEEYCRYLGATLIAHNIQLEIQRFPWEKIGWPGAFAQLKKSAPAWNGQWVLVQYTALAWSTRGLPSKFPKILKILEAAGARVAIVFHDVEPFSGTRFVDRLRRIVQIRTMRQALRLADCAIFTVPLANLSWNPRPSGRSACIPVGANLPIPVNPKLYEPHTPPTIGVFSITGGEAGVRETKLIVDAVRHASEKVGKLRLVIFGRHAELRETELRQEFKDSPVDLSVEGVISPEEVVGRLSACDLMFFVRGPISSRRGSAIAGIACGLPVIAFSGSETAVPITEAGVLLVPSDQPEQLNAALYRVLSDANLRAELASRSRSAYQQHFSWPSIASRLAAFLRDP